MVIEEAFVNLGGTFLTPANQIRESLHTIKAFIFDWDGVFNDGRKTNNSDSSFSEVDSMGINLLRFDYWLRNKRFPLIFIITGMKNQTATEFAGREHFNGIYLNVKNKKEALESICSNYRIIPEETAFIFDDVLDIEVAQLCGLSFCIRRKSNPLFTDFLMQNSVCNYLSAFTGEDHGVREICELLIGLTGDYKLALELRIKFKGEYEEFLTQRNSIDTDIVQVG
jgi:3-deoxy-D-manno-octulosonate 8-phosphate phosphatase (KDO 8-P phosphatase)